MEGSLSHLEAILGRRGAILGLLGAILGRLGGMLGHAGGLDVLPGPSWSLWRAAGRRNGRPETPQNKADSCRWTLGEGWVFRSLQKPSQTAFSILPRLNVPGGTVADLEQVKSDVQYIAWDGLIRGSAFKNSYGFNGPKGFR